MTARRALLRVPVEQVRIVMAQEPGLSELSAHVPAAPLHPHPGRADAGRIALRRRHPAAAGGPGPQPAGVAAGWTWRARPKPRRCCRALRSRSASCPSSSCPAGTLLRNPASRELLDALGLAGRPPPIAGGVRSAGRGRRARRAGRRGLRRLRGTWRRPSPRTPRSAARRAPRRASRTTSASPPACPARSWRPAARCRPRSSACVSSRPPKAVVAGVQTACTGSTSTTARWSRRSRSSSPPERATPGSRWTG